MAFNLMDIMNSSSQGAAMKYEPAEIDIDKISGNPANSIYTTGDIDKLAESIELAGRVLQNLVVKEADDEGHYMIISGHRRWLACRKLVEGGNEQYRTLPCLIEHEHDDLLQELMLIYSNSTIRVLNDAEKMRQAKRATEICRKLKEENRLEGRVRDIVASMLNESASQLARYAAIDSKLTNPELKEAFEDGRLKVSAAYEASGLSEEGQQQIADKLREEGGVSIQDVKEVKGQDREETWPALYPGTEEEIPSITVKVRDLDIKKKYKVTISISYIEHDGIFYAGYDYQTHNRGGGCAPHVEKHRGYTSIQSAIDDTIIYLSKMSPDLHEALWGSGYTVVGEPPRGAEEPPAESKVSAAEAKLQSQGYAALTDCEKCKITTRCEDCCRTCPPEKWCNVRQCQIENRAEGERIAKEQAEHNAQVAGFVPQKSEMRPRSELLQVAISEVEKRLEKLSDTAAAMAKLNEEEQKEEEAIIEKMKVDYYSRLLGLIRQEKTTIG